MAHVLNHKLYQPSRVWYTMRETLKIYKAGGHIILKVSKKVNNQKRWRVRVINRQEDWYG